MSILGNILCDLSGGCEPTSEAESPISSADMARAQSAIEGQNGVHPIEPPPAPADQARGLKELRLDFGTSGSTHPSWPNRTFRAKTFEIAGYGIYLARQGTAPRMRLRVTIGSDSVVLCPGEGFRVPFRAFTLENNSQFNTTGLGIAGGALDTVPARVIVARDPTAQWVESDVDSVHFRNVSVSDGSAGDISYSALHDGGAGEVLNYQTFETWRIYPQGFSKLRVYMRRHEDEDGADLRFGTAMTFMLGIYTPGCYQSNIRFEGPEIAVNSPAGGATRFFDIDVPGIGDSWYPKKFDANAGEYTRDEQPRVALYWATTNGTSRKAKTWVMGIQ